MNKINDVNNFNFKNGIETFKKKLEINLCIF